MLVTLCCSSHRCRPHPADLIPATLPRSLEILEKWMGRVLLAVDITQAVCEITMRVGDFVVAVHHPPVKFLVVVASRLLERS
jgi:hypothetical protein